MATRKQAVRSLEPRPAKAVTGGSAGQYAYLKLEMQVSSATPARKGG